MLLQELRLEVLRGEDSLNPAGDCGKPPSDHGTGFVLVIDGPTLDWALQDELKSDFLELSCRCKAVICCRSTPLQKSEVVRLIRDQFGVMTLAVGKDSGLCYAVFIHSVRQKSKHVRSNQRYFSKRHHRLPMK